MKIIPPSAEIVNASPNLEETIEFFGRLCYKSEDKIAPGTAEKFIARLMDSKHESVLEHGSISVHFVCDRGITHELVRHRIASFSQESTRYCNYGKEKFGEEITVIRPFFLEETNPAYMHWHKAMRECEHAYFAMLHAGCSPQEARSVLPNSLKTEIGVTANPREWLHIFRLRCAPTAHPQMREVMIPLANAFHDCWPSIFPKYEEFKYALAG